jgi:hypothetical protein
MRRWASRQILIAVIVASCVGVSARMAHAECGTGAAACEEFQRSDFVFFGEVVDIDAESSARAGSSAVDIRFHVIEGFKGQPARDLTIALSANSEEPRVALGMRAVVYLVKSGPIWSGACRRFHLAADVNDLEVSWLRAMRDHLPGGQVFGSVESGVHGSASGLGQIRVRLLQVGKPIAETRTGLGGHFDLGWRPPGAYVLDIPTSVALAGTSREIVVGTNSTCEPTPPIVLQPRQQ